MHQQIQIGESGAKELFELSTEIYRVRRHLNLSALRALLHIALPISPLLPRTIVGKTIIYWKSPGCGA